MIIRRRFLAANLAGLLLPAFLAVSAAAQTTPAGKWRTVDDKTGKPRSIVRIYEENGKLFGKVEQALDPARADRKCDKCSDERKGQPIVGMVIVRNLARNGNEWTGGDILDPDNGSVYRCKMKLSPDGQKLTVRGFMGVSILGRSQTWTREPS